ncbi:Brix-domain-containing protein [Trametes versicolor FP-101664 SS1]|uniref:Brix-domain-containing protein n=1 Tax=Trametes versicolor (strain FP-101664) TaxID=717944 RepID=UPI00046243E1|nr:Brix-domain-containing protein [Trametes versicolor FP-101664 SS1]EIW61119.1 Brix-domain-containing protein [Trametes versicolor FP-101664 SS1]
MLRTVKPKNARSKRVMQARESKEVEDPRTAIFVKGTHPGEKAGGVMKELMALKRPNAISFSKKNTVRPFEDASSLEFWAQKNDASMFVLGQSTKKRPDGLTFVRMFDYRVLDMCEVGVDSFKSMVEFKTRKATPGHKPLLHFASELFDSHPRFVQLKSMLIDFFNGEVIDSICLAGIEHVISISLGPTPPSLNAATTTLQASTSTDPAPAEVLPKVHIRAYTIRLLASGTRVPRVELTPMGPFVDLTMRRHQEADAELLKQALRRPKVRKQDVEKGLGKKRKNLEVDELGDLRGRIHVGKQNLDKLQTRKMKGLKASRDDMLVDVDAGEDMGVDEGGSGESGPEESGGERRKRRRAE